VVRFDKVIAQKAAHVDGAIYWKSFAQYKLARRRNRSMASRPAQGLSKESALNDAKVLEVDARRWPVNLSIRRRWTTTI
jgi:hypothetical protein